MEGVEDVGGGWWWEVCRLSFTKYGWREKKEILRVTAALHYRLV